MESLGWYEFQAEGLSLERFLNQCVQNNIRLRSVKKRSVRAITGRVKASDLASLQDLADARGWRLTVLNPRGMVRLSNMAKRRALLMAGVLAFVMLCWAAVTCIWFIDVRGAGPYTGEVRRILQAHDIKVGKFSFLIDTDAIRMDMERQLTGLAWVSAHMNGVRLTITCVQAQLAQSTSSAPGDLVADRDGVIASIVVKAGTPLKKVGDIVRRGQVLVRGEERAWDGAVQPIRAQAGVTARVWYTGKATVPGMFLESVPTGKNFSRHTLSLPFFEFVLEELPAFLDFDRVDSVYSIGGPFPILLRREYYEEVTRQRVERDFEAVKEEARIAALRIANEKVPTEVSVIDKWVEYSMMNDGSCCATVVLEAIVDIATTLEMI